MAESLRDLVVSLSLNTDNFTRNIRSVNKQIQEAESFFKLAGAGMKDFDTSAAGLAARMSTLQSELTMQNNLVQQYERVLAQATEKLQECYDRQNDYATRLEEARQRQADLSAEVAHAQTLYEGYKNSLGETDSATIMAEENLNALKEDYNNASEDVVRLTGQNEALARSTQNAADAVSTAQTHLNNARAACREMEAELQSTCNALRTAESAWTSAGRSLTEFSASCKRVADAATKAGRKLTMYVTTPIVTLGTTAVKASVDFESSFTSVRKTVDATEAEFDRLAAASKQMSTEIAASTSTINAVMATGGQLGIATENLEDFTRIMIDLGNSTEDLSAEEAATTIAKFANIMHTDQSLFRNIGSTLVELGNNFATTEEPIMVMAQRLAGAGKQVGLSEAQILGFAAALSSVGIEAQMGGSSFSKALIKMEVAAETGGEALDDFAQVAGLSAEEFKALWDASPADAFMAFIVGLSQLDDEGASAIKTLNDIGISEIRLRDTLLRATNATELFQSAQDMALSAWEENTALAEEANKRYATTASQFENLKNKAVLLGQTFGDDMNPMIRSLMESAGSFIDKLMELDSQQRLGILKWAAVVVAVGPVLSIFGKLTRTVSVISGALGTFFTAVGAAGGGIVGVTRVISSSALAMTALTAAVAYGTYKIWEYASGTKALKEEMEQLEKTAGTWKEKSATTFYTTGKGLEAFGLSTNQFAKDFDSGAVWLMSIVTEWSDKLRETDATVSRYINSFKDMTSETRNNLSALRQTATESGFGEMASQMDADLAELDEIDKRAEELIKKRQEEFLSDKDIEELNDLLTRRKDIEVRYHLNKSDSSGFTEIEHGVEAAIARAQASGEKVSDTVYQDAILAAQQGYNAMSDSINAEYDKRFEIVKLMDDEIIAEDGLTVRKRAQIALDTWYNVQRQQAAEEYLHTMGIIVDEQGTTLTGAVLSGESITDTYAKLTQLYITMADYSIGDRETLNAINRIFSGLSESDLVQMLALFEQIGSMKDIGLSDTQISEALNLTPQQVQMIRFAKEQIAGIQDILNQFNTDASLDPLLAMFGTQFANEMITVMTDLNLDGAKARWAEFAEDPGSVIQTTADVIGLNGNGNTFILTDADVEASAVLTGVSGNGESFTVSNAVITADGTLTGVDGNGKMFTATNCTVNANGTLTGVDGNGQAFTVSNVTVTTAASLTGVTGDGKSFTVVNAVINADGTLTGVDGNGQTFTAANCTVNADGTLTGVDGNGQTFTVSNANVSVEAKVDLGAIDSKVAETWRLKNADKVTLVSQVQLPVSAALGGDWQTDLLTQYKAGCLKVYGANGVPLDVTPEILSTLSPSAIMVGIDENGVYHLIVQPEWENATVEEVKEDIARLTERVSELNDEMYSSGGSAWNVQRNLAAYRAGNTEGWAWYEKAAGWVWDLVNAQEWLFTVSTDGLDGAAETIGEIVNLTMKGEAYVSDIEGAADYLANMSRIVRVLISSGQGLEIVNEIVATLNSMGINVDAEGLADYLGDFIRLSAAMDLEATRAAKREFTDQQWATDYMQTTLTYLTKYYGLKLDAEKEGHRFNNTGNLNSELKQADRWIKKYADDYAYLIELQQQGAELTEEDTDFIAAYEALKNNSERIRMELGLLPTESETAGQALDEGLAQGIIENEDVVVSAVQGVADAAMGAFRSAFKIHSPSRLMRDEIGMNIMRGIGEGITEEAKNQGRVIQNAARYLTDEAQVGTLSGMTARNYTYNTDASVSFAGATFTVQDKTDVYALAQEIAALTRRQQAGRGTR